MNYVPDKGSGGAGSNHKGQSVEKSGGQGTARKSFGAYGSSAANLSGMDTPKPKDTSKKSPKIFG